MKEKKRCIRAAPILKILSKRAPENSKCWSRSHTVCCTDSPKATSPKTNYCKTFSLGSLFYSWEEASGGLHTKNWSYFKSHTHLSISEWEWSKQKPALENWSKRVLTEDTGPWARCPLQGTFYLQTPVAECQWSNASQNSPHRITLSY